MRRVYRNVIIDDIEASLEAAFYFLSHYEKIPWYERSKLLDSYVAGAWLAPSAIMLNHKKSDFIAEVQSLISKKSKKYSVTNTHPLVHKARDKEDIYKIVKRIGNTMAQHNGQNSIIADTKLAKFAEDVTTVLIALGEGGADMARFIVDRMEKEITVADRTNRPTFVTEQDEHDEAQDMLDAVSDKLGEAPPMIVNGG